MKHWYVMAYDVRHQRRLKRLHYYLGKRAFALQNSVFLIHENAEGLESLTKGVRERVDIREDDVRLYPVDDPSSLWVAGKQTDALAGLYSGSSKKQQMPAKGMFRSFIEKVTKASMR